MPQPIKLTYAEVVEKGRKAYLEGRLSAQGPTPQCAYRDVSGRPCIIGAALTDDEARYLDRADEVDTGIQMLVECGRVKTRASRSLRALQNAHDDWVHGRSGAETRLRKLLNIEEAA